METMTESQDVPRTVIPPNRECILHGIADIFMPQIAKCSLGGWIVVLEGKGISAFTSLREAMHFVGETAHDVMGEIIDPLPDGIKPAPPERGEVIQFEERIRPSMAGIVASVVAALALALSAKISL